MPSTEEGLSAAEAEVEVSSAEEDFSAAEAEVAVPSTEEDFSAVPGYTFSKIVVAFLFLGGGSESPDRRGEPERLVRRLVRASPEPSLSKPH